MFDVFLDLLYPLEADTRRTDDESCPGLDLVPLYPAVRTAVLAPVRVGDVVLDTLRVLLSPALGALDPVPGSVWRQIQSLRVSSS